MHEQNIENEWDEFYKEQGEVMIGPSKDMQWLIQIFQNHNVKKILDIGCGPGRNAIYLAKQGYILTAIDYSKFSLEILQKKAGNLPIKVMLESVQNLPFEDNSFDAIICRHVLSYINQNNIDKVMKEMHRVTKKNGIVYIKVLSSQHVLSNKTSDTLPEGFSQVHWLIQHNHIPKFFDEDELRKIFHNYKLLKFEHNIGAPTDKLKFPLHEWIILGQPIK